MMLMMCGDPDAWCRGSMKPPKDVSHWIDSREQQAFRAIHALERAATALDNWSAIHSQVHGHQQQSPCTSSNNGGGVDDDVRHGYIEDSKLGEKEDASWSWTI